MSGGGSPVLGERLLTDGCRSLWWRVIPRVVWMTGCPGWPAEEFIHSGKNMGNRNQCRAMMRLATEADGEAGACPEDGDGSRPESEDDTRMSGGGDGAGQKRKREQARVAEVPVSGVFGRECAIRDLRLRAGRGWS